MKIASWAQGHTRSLLFLALLLAAGGIASVFQLPVGLFPQVSFPRVRISLDAGDRPAERMVIEVTRPAEEAVRAIPGVRHVRSTSSRGSADIDVDFDWGHDMIAATLQVESQINKLLASLPQGTSFDVSRMDPTVFPVIAYSLTSDTRPLTEMFDLATYQLRPVLATVNGVSKVSVQGGAIEEYRVVIDPAKLQSFGLTLNDVAAKLAASNVLVAVGRLQDHDKLYLVVSDTRFKGLEQINKTVLRSGAQGVVTLEDVAMVRHDTEPQFIRVTADGHDAVLMNIYQQPGSNTVQIARDIKAKLQEERKNLPPGVKVANWYDQSDLILASESSVRDAIAIGIGLAALVLLVFLRNWKITLIAMIAVPAVLATTVLLLNVLHMSFNIMTLGGMAAAVGLIIDDSIVMIEHITRRLSQGAGAAGERVMHAAGEFTRPLAGSSLSTIVIFAPLAFLSGVTGAFFKALSLTMAAALVISFFIAWLVVPILASHWLGPKDAEQQKPKDPDAGISGIYRQFMAGLLRHSWLVLLAIVPLLILGYIAFQRVGTGFMPAMDEGGFILDYIGPSGTSLPETDRLLRQVEAILQANPAVQTYSRRTGLQLGGAVTESNQGDFFVRLKPFPRPSTDEVMQQVRKKVEKTVPGLEIETAQLMEDLIGDLTSVPQPIEIKLFASDQQTLLDAAPTMADAIQKVTGVVEVKNGIFLAGDALDIEVDRVKAGLEGMDPDAVTKLVSDALTGVVTTTVQRGPKLVGVRVWVPERMRKTQRDIGQIPLRAPDGHVFPLKRVATVTAITGQPQITREDLRPMIPITGRIENRDLGSTIADVKAALRKPGLVPPGITYEFGGEYQQQQIAFRGLLMVLIAAILLVFVLLLFLYERLRIALAMLAVMLLAIAGVIIGLWITGTERNITSLMGLTMIVGIVTEVSIFYGSELAEISDDRGAHDRLIAAGAQRARAILMTTIAAILALLPLALAIGQGSGMLQPLAIAIIAGLIAQLPLVLVVLPALLALFRATSGQHGKHPLQDSHQRPR
ncbi:MAG TPA: efflux RND transporter permease subunit [Tepidisphaeraceae bacterium]|nr:efflux RND transporter permease subunit [Tepidisphaeraceae bacterium]